MVYVLFVYFCVFVWLIRSLGVRNASINEELHCRQRRSKDENVLVWCGKLAYFPLDKMAAISQMHFGESKVLYIDNNFTEICS